MKILVIKSQIQKSIFFLLGFIFFSSVFAETIVLKSGEKIQGEIIEKNKEYVKLKTEDKELTFFFGDLDLVGEEKVFDSLGFMSNPGMVSSQLSKRAAIYNNQENYELALKNYTNAINAAKSYPDLHINSLYELRAYVNLKLGNFDQAASDFQKSSEISPYYKALVYRQKGYAYALKGEYLKAVAEYQAALQIVPQNRKFFIGTIYEDQGSSYVLLGKYSKASEVFKKDLIFFPKTLKRYFYNAINLFLQKEYQRAKENLAKAESYDVFANDKLMNKAKEKFALDLETFIK